MLNDSEGKEVPRGVMNAENAAKMSDGDSDGSSGVDLVSSDVDRVSNNGDKFKKANSNSHEDGRGLYRVKKQAGRVSGDKKKDYHKNAVVSNSDKDSKLSYIDDYTANGKSPRVGYGSEVGDMVWAKVKSHPWWPGHIFNEAFATPSVRKIKREGHILVAFFGDSSYGWFEPAELIPFEPHFAEKSKQTTSRTFIKAVEDAVDELNKRRSLGFSCRCRNPYSFRPTDVKGYLAVDFSDTESGVFSVSQIRSSRDSFVPGGMLSFVKELALKPMNDDHRSIHFIQEKAAYLAFRKAVYEEFDETYAQAFGAQPQRRDQATKSTEPCRAPLSSRLVFAEALGKKKSPGKHSKPKDQSEKDKYLLKRRDDPPDLQVKEPQPDVARPVNQADVSDVLEPSQNSPVPASDQKNHLEVADEIHEDKNTIVKTNNELKKKVKVRKRVHGDTEDSEGFVAVEKEKKKIKKRTKDLVNETKLDQMDDIQSATTIDADTATLTGQVHEKLPGPYPVHNNNQENDIATPQHEDLPRLLDELLDLALDPFYGAEKNSFPSVLNAFMNFRSLVYLKSPSIEPKEAHPSLLSTKRPPSDRLEEMVVKKKKKVHDVKSLAAEKRSALKNQESDVHRADGGKEVVRKPTSEPVKKKVQPPLLPPAKAAGPPMMLIMKFPAEAALPSGAELRAKFARFGPMDYKATRIFYTTHTCRVVYYRKNDAEAALNFAASNYGSMNVRCFLREAEDPHRTPVVAGPLKSCLKKPPSSDGGGGNVKGRVKFLLDGEDDSTTASNNTDKFQMVVPPHSPKKIELQLPMNVQNQPVVAHGGSGLLPPPTPTPPKIDINEQMLCLLSRCESIMKSLEGAMGYMPYYI